MYYNNDTLGRAGTMIIINNSLKDMYHIAPRRLADAATGRIQVLRLYPRHNPVCSFPLQIFNFYLPASTHSAKRASLLALLQVKRPKEDMYTIAMGDYNFIEQPGDHTPESPALRLDNTTRRIWNRITAKFKLTELGQPVHTYYHVTDSLSTTRTSRIDRVYTSYSDADDSIVHPQAYLPHLERTKLHDFERLLDPTLDKDMGQQPHTSNFTTDHLPIAIRFAPPDRVRRPYRPNAPKWLAAHPQIKAGINDRWNRDKNCPYKDLQHWKQSVLNTVKGHFYRLEATKQAAGTRTASLSAAISLYRTCTAQPYSPQRTRSLLSAHTSLGDLVDLEQNGDRAPDVANLHEHITGLIIEGATTEQPDNAKPDTDNPLATYPPPPAAPSLGRNFSPLDELKGRLPSARKGLHHLRETPASAPTSDPAEMGAIAKRSWSKIWDKRIVTPTAPALQDYLKDYTTHMPDGALKEMPTLDIMVTAIQDTNNSSSGPDGIPFAYYRLCAEEIAPVLLRILKLLAKGHKPPEGFNYGSLFLLPKDDSLLIEHTRPISVANADNRIIAKLLANLLGPELNKILHASQKGFIPGRCGLDHIHDLTASFYGAAERGDQRYVLFLDTKKAFDSVDHRFVHAMLKKIGLPGWMRNTIHGLMSNVKVRPVFASKAEHDISILRGVKQGCPLSPLLFAMTCFSHSLPKRTITMPTHSQMIWPWTRPTSDQSPVPSGISRSSLTSRALGLT